MKRWSEEEIKLSVDYINGGLTYDEIAELIHRTKKSVRIKLNKLGVYVKPKINIVEKNCLCCGEKFTSLISEGRKYCSQSCSAKENNKLRNKRSNLVNFKLTDNSEFVGENMNSCLNCGFEINNNSKTYCCLTCFHEFRKKQYKDLIESGDETLPARQYKNFLINKYGNHCMICGWGEVNQYTNTIPIELEHKDGNSLNNSLGNLMILCPNCHSLTKTYKGANVGNGRYYRRERYKNGKSY